MAARERSNNRRAGRRKSNNVMPETGRESISPVVNGPHVDGRPDSQEEDYRRSQIALAAYYRAERRGFGGHHELDDWLEAEREVNSRMDAAAAFGRLPKIPGASDTHRDLIGERGYPPPGE